MYIMFCFFNDLSKSYTIHNTGLTVKRIVKWTENRGKVIKLARFRQ